MIRKPSSVDAYAEIHATQRYGDTSVKNLRFLRPFVRVLRPKSILDFGCGQSRLGDRLRLPFVECVTRYEPAIPELATPPEGAFDLLINVDVLEHVPEAELDGVLADMRAYSPTALIVIDTEPAVQLLPDGGNAHCTLHPASWWRERLLRFYDHAEPIRVARRRRAAFRTFSLTSAQRAEVAAWTAVETLVHMARRVRRASAQ